MSRRWIKYTLFLVGIAVALLCAQVLLNLSPRVMEARSSRAQAEMKNIDLALIKLLTDANRQDFRSLLDATVFDAECKAYMASANLDAFEASTRIYTVCLTALLRDGKNVSEAPTWSDKTRRWLNTIDPSIYRKLGDKYMDLGTDPWGNPYYMFAGPWPAEWGPKVFRTYRADSHETPKTDVLTVGLNYAGEGQVGFVPREPFFYLWSLGPNKVSDQARFDPGGMYPPPALQYYRSDAAWYELGGGDDVNNWDYEQTWRIPQHKIPSYRLLYSWFFDGTQDLPFGEW